MMWHGERLPVQVKVGCPPISTSNVVAPIGQLAYAEATAEGIRGLSVT